MPGFSIGSRAFHFKKSKARGHKPQARSLALTPMRLQRIHITELAERTLSCAPQVSTVQGPRNSPGVISASIWPFALRGDFPATVNPGGVQQVTPWHRVYSLRISSERQFTRPANVVHALTDFFIG